MQLLQKVKDYIGKHNLLFKDQKILIGVSGGADSMALLHILHSLGYQIIVAHCNFHLRGEESNRDEAFVTDYCSKNNFKFISVSFDTYGYMKVNSVSLEMAARELRYNWFEESRIKYKADKIAVAHHQDDSVETFMINLIRGTGIKGLTGISPSNGIIIRPLLGITQDEINAYIKVNRIPFVTDSTNNEDEYLRNKIRLNIIPLLEEINPSFRMTIAQTSNYLSETEEIYNKYIILLKEKIFKDNKINIRLLSESGHARTLLFEILHPYGFNSATINDIFESTDSISGKIFYSEKYCLVKDREYFILNPITENQNDQYYYIDNETSEIKSPLKLTIEKFDKDKNIEIKKDKNTLFIDSSTIVFPLLIRRWKQGDRFIPFGMKGSKKLSDYFSDNKFSIIDKQNVWILCDSDDRIIWIIGERSDNRFKITDNTDEILKIELTEP